MRVIKGIVWSRNHCLIKFILGLSSFYYRLLEPETLITLWYVGIEGRKKKSRFHLHLSSHSFYAMFYWHVGTSTYIVTVLYLLIPCHMIKMF